ncbi:GNAT family N-acetyltransferase [Micromonospora sp. MS34]|uniref:GNAT family N-acetyltransferase n=1 Tax=Micromonospora sp. MS34 TaxID=3385971 RepID=UPI00399FD145
MQLIIERADFTDHRLGEFLRAHLADLAPTAPVESRHALDLRGLQTPEVRLWVAFLDGQLVGTGALAAVEPGHEELKSMRTDPRQRGQGIATRILVHLLGDARGRGIRRISLETGSMDFFVPARSLYAKAGFVPCAPFGRYAQDPNSVFLTKIL